MNVNKFSAADSEMAEQFVKGLSIEKDLKKYYFNHINEMKNNTHLDDFNQLNITNNISQLDAKDCELKFSLDNNQLKIDRVNKNQIKDQIILESKKIISDYQAKLEKIKQKNQISVKERLDQLMVIEPVPATKEEEALRVQNILSLLDAENQLMKASIKEVEVDFKSEQLIGKAKKNGHVVKQGEFYFFVMDAQLYQCLEQTEYMAFLLQGQSLLDNQENNKPIDYSNYQFLEYLMRHPNEAIQECAQSLYYFFQNRHLTSIRLEAISELFKQIRIQVKNRFWIQTLIGEIVTPLQPLLVLLISDITYKQILFNQLSNNYEGYYEDFYNLKNQINSFWLETRNQQKELYCLAYQKLEGLIKNAKNKRDFYSYKKNLTILEEKEKGGQVFKEPSNFYSDLEIFDVEAFLKAVVTAPLEGKKQTNQQKTKEKKAVKGTTKKPQKSKKKNANKKIKNSALTKKMIVQSTIDSKEHKEETIESNAKNQQESLTVHSISVFPYQLDLRVNRWLDHPFGLEFSAEQFPEYAHYSLSYQKLMHRLHGFSPVLFHQFYEMGIKTTWQNTLTNHQDLCYLIPAEMRFENKQIRGVISLAIDATGTCYHRYFKRFESHELLEKMRCHDFAFQDFIDNELENHQLLTNLSEKESINRQIGQAFASFDYPTLHQAAKIRSQLASLYLQEEQVKIDPVLGSVYLTDPKKEMELILFRVKPI